MPQQNFTHPKTPQQLGQPSLTVGPPGVVDPNGIPNTQTGTRYSNIIGAMILAMSAEHGKHQQWLSVPFHMLYWHWIYREMGLKLERVTPGHITLCWPVDLERLDEFPDPETVTFDYAVRSLNLAVTHLLNEGYVVAVRDDDQDHLVPTDKLVASLPEF